MSDTPGEILPPVPERPPRRAAASGGVGCWLPTLMTVFVALVLVIVGLFLPPVDLWNRLFGAQYAMLDAEANATRSTDGTLTLVVDPNDPGSDFGVALDTVPLNTFLSGSTRAGWAAEALAATPPYLALQSDIYTIDATGTAPDALTLDIAIPAAAGSPDVLSLYGWDPAANRWRFVPSHHSGGDTLTASVSDLPGYVGVFQVAPPSQPTVLVPVDVVQTLSPEVAQLANIIAPAGLQPTLEGTLTGSLAAGFDLNAGYLVMPVIRNFVDPRALDPETAAAIMQNAGLRSAHVTQLTAFASSNGFSGIIIDYRELPADQRDNFSAFISELGRSLNDSGLMLGVVVPPAANVAGAWETGAYDWRALGAAADFVQINLPLMPQTYTPGADQLVEAMLRWASGEIDRYKILIGLSARSVREVGGAFTPIGFAEAMAGLGDVRLTSTDANDVGIVPPGGAISADLDGMQATSNFDPAIQTPYIEYRDENSNPVATMWLTDGDALRFRMDRTIPFALGGVAFGDLLANGVSIDVPEAILNYKLQLPVAPTPNDLALRWRIEGAPGMVGEALTGLNEPLAITIEAPDGNYAVNVDVVDGAVAVPRGGAAVALFAPTPTPTPLPTATPTPVPTATPQPVAAAPAAPANPGSAAPAVAPGAGSIAVGNFEYGGHVTSTGSDRAVGAMQSAGMTWMKVQVRYGRGMGPDVVSEIIGNARARGFRVLLGVVGDPNQLAAGGADYLQDFANFLGGVAAQGPDAIEVWNEPNIDREWPTGQISGAAYAEMLRLAYQSIKSANGSVLVISGAPAPTGAEAAFPGRVVNDDNWIRDMVNAGGLQYMDCLGAHYNEGIVAPSARGGDPRDNYYTRYFFGMLDTYWGLIGGQKPICFTELGYLTSEGYPPLPDFFAWASGVTLQQQAAWLAEAAALASQSGRVRLMIVWNVDFTLYGSDPQAGYAMIRPDGSCPACNAMAAAR